VIRSSPPRLFVVAKTTPSRCSISTKKRTIRCLKRYIVREIYNTHRHDLETLSLT